MKTPDTSSRSAPWFAPKRFGYGAGLPIAWQGWVLLALYLGVMIGGALLLATTSPLAFFGIATVATVLVVLIAARKTRGGWRWRGGA